MNEALAQSAVKFLIRRGLTILGTAGTQVSDDWVTQTASLAVIALNEGYQWWQSHKAEQHKAAGTFDATKS